MHRIYWVFNMQRAKNACRVEWTQDRIEFVAEQAKSVSDRVIAERFTQRFGVYVTLGAIKGIRNRYKLSTGRTGRFEKGNPSWNAGTKGVMKPCKTSFKKGQSPHNEKPLGSERVTKDGITEVKISMVGKSCERWKSKHSLLWEQRTGKKVPDGHVIMFADGDRNNFDQNNLRLVSRRANVINNKRGYSHKPKEIKPVLLALAQLDAATNKAREAV